MEGDEEQPQASLEKACEGLWRMQNADMDCFLVIFLEAFQGGSLLGEVLDCSQRGREMRWRL